eukprot:SAG31_NODE_983_length_10554_cov_6.049259_5_plen_224_part_00
MRVLVLLLARLCAAGAAAIVEPPASSAPEPPLAPPPPSALLLQVTVINCTAVSGSSFFVPLAARLDASDGSLSRRIGTRAAPDDESGKDCYFLDFYGTFPAESPMYAPRNPGLIEKVSPCRQHVQSELLRQQHRDPLRGGRRVRRWRHVVRRLRRGYRHAAGVQRRHPHGCGGRGPRGRPGAAARPGGPEERDARILGGSSCQLHPCAHSAPPREGASRHHTG